VNISKAEKLLSEAATAKNRLQRHLFVAAALTEVLDREPIVVGGTAQEYHTAMEYHETDLDLVGWVSKKEEPLLRRLGFRKWGRHWFHEPSNVAVEFPESRLAGDESRILHHKVSGGTVALIGVDDLYLDRVRQAKANRRETSTEFRSAVAVGVAAAEMIDWRYVARQIQKTRQRDPLLGKEMSRVDSAVRRLIRKSISE
jgi:hypothetical protein